MNPLHEPLVSVQEKCPQALNNLAKFKLIKIFVGFANGEFSDKTAYRAPVKRSVTVCRNTHFEISELKNLIRV